MNENNWFFSWPVLTLIAIFACGALWGLAVQELPFWSAICGGVGLVTIVLELMWEISSRKNK